jgi:hypothetical protein
MGKSEKTLGRLAFEKADVWKIHRNLNTDQWSLMN